MHGGVQWVRGGCNAKGEHRAMHVEGVCSALGVCNALGGVQCKREQRATL